MIAHILTLSRVVFAAGLAIVVACIQGRPMTDGGAAALLTLAAVAELTDAIDGIAARRLGTAGQLGGLLDPLADSLARLTIYFAMAMAGWVSIVVPLVMAGRDIIVAYTRVIQAIGGASTSARISGKVKAIVQGGAIFAIIALAWRGGDITWAPSARTATAAAVIAVTLWSLLDYIRGCWRSVRQMHNTPMKSTVSGR